MSRAAVVFEDERLVAVDKPAGQPTVAGRGQIGEPLNAELARRLGRRIYVVHRLDREASGLVLFAKTAEAHAELCGLFARRQARKSYLAAVLGEVGESGEISLKLREFGSGRAAVDAKRGKECLTRFRPRRRLRGATLLEVELVTGRRHQIRAHLYAIGHPILGDPLYGDSRPVGGAPRLMLHAWKLAVRGAPILAAEPGPDFAAVVAGRGA